MTAKELWYKFCSEREIDEATPYEAWAFGDGAVWGDDLLELVLQGRKFGTASAYDEYVAENVLENGWSFADIARIKEADMAEVLVKYISCVHLQG